MINWKQLAQENNYLDDRAMFMQLYYRMQYSASMLSRKLNISYQSILNRIRYHNIPVRSRGGPNNRGSVMLNLVLERDNIRSMTAREAARKYGCDVRTVRRAGKKYGLKFRRVQ